MTGKGHHGSRAIVSYAEAAGLVVEKPAFRFRADYAPRVMTNEPRKDWVRNSSISLFGHTHGMLPNSR